MAGVKYSLAILGERRLLESQGEDVSSGAIIDVMRKLWQVSNKINTPNDINETSLADANYFAQIKECFHCGKKGHLRDQCPKLKGRHDGTPSGKVWDLCR